MAADRWKYSAKEKRHYLEIADGLNYQMVVYSTEQQFVITCRSGHLGACGSLTFANSLLSAKIQAEELKNNGLWFEFTPEFLDAIPVNVVPVPAPQPKPKNKPPKTKKKQIQSTTKAEPIKLEAFEQLKAHFGK